MAALLPMKACRTRPIGAYRGRGTSGRSWVVLCGLDTSSCCVGEWDWFLYNSTDSTRIDDLVPSLTEGTITVTPEPAVIIQLLGLAAALGPLVWLRRRRRLAAG